MFPNVSFHREAFESDNGNDKFISVAEFSTWTLFIIALFPTDTRQREHLRVAPFIFSARVESGHRTYPHIAASTPCALMPTPRVKGSIFFSIVLCFAGRKSKITILSSRYAFFSHCWSKLLEKGFWLSRRDAHGAHISSPLAQ
jgi:hypothetical protein